MSFYLFTYGTLMREQQRNYILGKEKFVKQFELEGIRIYNYFDEDYNEESGMYSRQNYPVALLDDTGKVSGEIYLCDDILLSYLDQIEGVGNLYNRYSFIDDEHEVMVYIGIDEFWKPHIGKEYLMPCVTPWFPHNNTD